VRFGIWLLIFVAAIVGILAAAFFGLTRRFTVESKAMEPKVKKGDEVAVFRFSDSVGPPTRRDVVVLSDRKSPGCGVPGKYSIARVIGIPGETVTERRGAISIHGKLLEEGYVKPENRDARSGTWHVPKDSYLVFGDNRRSACAAPYVVRKKNVVGFVIFTYWPFDRIAVGQ
jgi:signal peptidase I